VWSLLKLPSFVFSSLVPVPGVFPSFIYLLDAHGGFSRTGETG